MLLPAVFRGLLVAWLVYVAVYDWRTWTVPWWTTWPVIIAACLGHAGLGAWVPLVLLVLYYLWDTTVGDLKRLLRWRFIDTERDDRRWLIPDLVAFALTVALLAVARGQGEAAFFFTAGFALVHLLWRLGRLPGGRCGLAHRATGAVSQPALPESWRPWWSQPWFFRVWPGAIGTTWSQPPTLA